MAGGGGGGDAAQNPGIPRCSRWTAAPGQPPALATGSGGAGLAGWGQLGATQALGTPLPGEGGVAAGIVPVGSGSALPSASAPGACSADADTKPEEPRPFQVSRTPPPLPEPPAQGSRPRSSLYPERRSHPLAGGQGRRRLPAAASQRGFAALEIHSFL